MEQLNDGKAVDPVKPVVDPKADSNDIPLIPEMSNGKAVDYTLPPLPKDKRRGGKDWRPPYFNDLVAFFADPSEQRSIKQWCEDIGVDENTVHAYKRNHPVELWSAVDNTRQVYIPKMRREAFNAVFANIKKSHLDRKLALQLTNDLIERSSTGEKALTPDEKRDLAKEILQKLGSKITKGE